MISVLKAGFRHSALFVFAAIVVVFASRGAAQNAKEAAEIAATLQPGSQAGIERLLSLNELTDGRWKMHSGDMAHGEAVNLDESSWEAKASGSKAPNDAVWFRQ